MRATCFEPLLQDEVDALTSQYAAGLRDFQAFRVRVYGGIQRHIAGQGQM